MLLHELARAKVNLTLTVLGRRADGYHEIESLVTFADVGDRVTLLPGPDRRIAVSGPFADEITGRNLLERALDLLSGLDPGLRLGTVRLEKNLPVAAGLGGGSADAAALLRAVRRDNPDRANGIDWHRAALRLGADVPVCLAGRPALMRGIGERVEPLAGGLPPMAAVFVNPRRHLATMQVFAALAAPSAPVGRSPSLPPGPFAGLDDLVDYMRRRGNDLERAAAGLLPAVTDIKKALAATAGCRLAAMSGSGPTCFGIFATYGEAVHAAAGLAAAMPDFWSVPARLGETADADPLSARG